MTRFATKGRLRSASEASRINQSAGGRSLSEMDMRRQAPSTHVQGSAAVQPGFFASPSAPLTPTQAPAAVAPSTHATTGPQASTAVALLLRGDGGGERGGTRVTKRCKGACRCLPTWLSLCVHGDGVLYAQHRQRHRHSIYYGRRGGAEEGVWGNVCVGMCDEYLIEGSRNSYKEQLSIISVHVICSNCCRLST